MQQLIILLAGIYVVSAGGHSCTLFKDLVNQFAKISTPLVCECLEETYADPVLVDNWLYYGEFANDYDLKCAIKCILEKLELLDPCGHLDLNVLKKLLPLPDHEVKKIYDKCAHDKCRDPCESAFKVNKCIYNAIKEAVHCNEAKPSLKEVVEKIKKAI